MLTGEIRSQIDRIWNALTPGTTLNASGTKHSSS
jgi:hypothetical protein